MTKNTKLVPVFGLLDDLKKLLSRVDHNCFKSEPRDNFGPGLEQSLIAPIGNHANRSD